MTFITVLLAAALATGSAGLPDSREIVGPKTLCFKYSRFQLVEGEHVINVQMGIEAMLVEVEGPTGRYEIGESEMYGGRPRSGVRVRRANGVTYYRNGDPIRYTLAGRTTYSPNRDVALVRLSGPAFTGRRADEAIFDRIALGDNADWHCDMRYRYGWDIALGLEN